MTSLRINREFALRHLGVAVLMAALSGWFAYDGYIAYPRQDDAYFEARHLRRAAAIDRQKEFMALAFLAAILIGGHVFAIARFRFAFDDEGFVFRGKRRSYADIVRVDWSKWEKKDILAIETESDRIVLDGWHHLGVKEFAEKMKGRKSGK